MNKLFVYGIFLDEFNRQAYGMSNPKYATVKHYVTVGHHIVAAVPVDKSNNCALTGLLVDMNPKGWDKLDSLEGDYDRIEIETTDREKAFMYVAK